MLGFVPQHQPTQNYLLRHPAVGEGMPCLTTPHDIHVQRVSNAQITSFIHDHSDNRINVYGTAAPDTLLLFRMIELRRSSAAGLYPGKPGMVKTYSA